MALNFLNDGYFAGKVGIGVETPTYTLELQVSQPDENPVVYSQFGGNNGVTGNSFLQIGGARGSAADERYSYLQTLDGAGGFRILSLNPSGGNVGIGTVSPDRKLHVKDSAIVVSEFEGTNTGSLMDLVNSNSSQLYNGIRFTQGTTSKMAITHIADGTTKGYIQIGNSWATGSEILVVDGRTSNVGIGTTGPTEKLDVSGTAIVRSTLFTAGNVHGFTSSYGASFFINNGGGTSYFNATGGNVGIGTTSPTQKLHVAGNLRVTGAYYDSNNSPGAANQVLVSTVSGTDWIDGSAIPGVPAGSGAAGQVTVWSGTDVITGYTRFQVYDAGGQIQITDGTRDIRINSGYSGSIAMIGTSSSHDLGFMTGNSQRVTIDTSGNVGIGTTSPNAYSNQTTLTINGSTYGRIDLESGGTLRSSLFSQAANTSLTVDTGFFSLDTGGSERMRITSTGNVGIGVTNPSDYYPTANDLVLGGNANNGMTIASTNVGAIHFADGSTGAAEYAGYIAYQHSDNKMRFGVNESDKLVILSGGNVGIGTTSPSAKLEVTGNTRLGSGTFHVSSDATLVTSATYTFRDGVYINNPNSTSAAAASGNVMSIGASSGNAVFTSLITTGAIGIGKSNPSAQLDVVGTGNFTGLVSGITPVNAANFVTKAYVDGSGGGTGPFLPLAGGTMTGVTQFNDHTQHGDQVQARWGASNDFTIEHNATDSSITNITGDLYITNKADDKDIVFRSDDGSGGFTTYFQLDGSHTQSIAWKDIHFVDGIKAKFGDYASPDLQIYHDGSNSYINETGTGSLVLKTGALLVRNPSDASMLDAQSGGAINLYYNGSKKFETTSVGVTVTGDIKIDSALLSNQENTDVDTGTETVASVAVATYTAAFFDFVIKKTTNVRSGTVYACHDGTNVEFTETSTQDLGDTSDVTLSVDISGGNMRLRATTTSDDWSIKSLIRAI